MKLVILRDQAKGMGAARFSIKVKVEVSDEERENIKKYNLGSTLLYANAAADDSEKKGGIIRGIVRLIFGLLMGNSSNVKFTIFDLINGKKIECKDVVEMLEIESTVMDVCDTFKKILDASQNFGGEVAIEL